MDLGQLLTLLLGGGCVATITALFNGIKSIREGTRTRERDTIADLIKSRDEAEEEREDALDERDWWRNWAGQLEYICHKNGIELPPKTPMPNGMNNDR
jgi:hypothetical protein